MAYFETQLGERPGDRKPAPNPAGPAPERHYFAAQLGPAPDPPAEPAGAPEPEPQRFADCPLCRGALANQRGLYHCLGRCGARWLVVPPGRLLDVAALPLGICGCCEPPQPLARAEAGAICPASGRQYLLLPDGPAQRSAADTLAAIDAALRRNTARLTVNGLFELDD
jgi:hypothetical protein